MQPTLPSCHSEIAAEAVTALPFSAHCCENGLVSIHQESTVAPVVVADVWVRAGAAAEPSDRGGMAHFLEHMLFKGTDRLPPGAFDWEIESCGGMTNAATSHDYAHFYLTIAAEYLPQTLPHLADLLLHPALPADEFERERWVVLEEIRACQDDPEWLGFQRLSELLYGDHAYGRSVLGEPEQLQAYTPEHMRQFYQSCYQPENLAIALVGAIDRSRASTLIEEHFTGFAPQPPSVATPAATPVKPMQEIQRDRLQVPRLEAGRLLMGWLGPGVEDMQTGYCLDLLATVLAEGRTSRLVRELREERHLAWDVGSTFSLQRDASLFTIAAIAAPEDLAEIEQILCDRLAEIAATPIAEVELHRAQRLLCQDYAFSTETPGQLAGLYGYYQTLTNRADLALAYPQRIGQLTATDLQQVARRYLSSERYAVVTVEPT
ncbi:MAG: pitrilysin family protein [Cyanobacteria bacterium J06641_5]